MDSEHRNRMITEMMGKPVHIIVYRPIGYQHGDMVYPVNYGYIPGLMAGDGEEQDAYILGVRQPLAEFDGQVIGAIRRMNDCEDKLVVAPVGQVYHQGQIAEAVHFQEQILKFVLSLVLKNPVEYYRTGLRKERRNFCWFLRAFPNAGACPKGI